MLVGTCEANAAFSRLRWLEAPSQPSAFLIGNDPDSSMHLIEYEATNPPRLVRGICG